ncbi:MauE/DoxX family redox-associated membrane protein [Ornithinimicrobium pekingense]|uniref:Methylamine utilisation protein MauE domain-containing protein n=1 Tax=Ornithinimicrobium pekingense TaxID=384677 RepID=A0ABQ2F6G6_9MICO|nr:MauE/DoxX family redox-associated membrane protein [Ornithinimicrobium pekingense]GGK66007.1 hypothetical protein GCM10011509_12900 [Ornithinimicrobium pekingense]
MLPALSSAPLALVAVLVLSGVAKLRDPGSTASMIALLRLPAVLGHRLVPRAVPVVELVTAALLLTPWRWTYAVGAAASLGLFTAFLLVIARAMTFDPRPTCGCFGRVGDHRVNGRTVTRNVLLLALAVVTAWLAVEGTPAAALVRTYDAGDVLWLAMTVVLATVAVLVLGGGARTAPSGPSPRRRRTRGARAGTPPAPAPTARPTAASSDDEPDELDDYERTPVPHGVLLAEDLDVVPLRRLVRDRAQLLVLVNCWCGPTFESVARLPRWRETLPQLGVQLVHTHRPWEEERLAGTGGVWWDPGSTVYDALRAGASPAAVLLGADGLLAGGPVNGVEEIEELVAQIARQLAEAPTPGQPAPEGQPAR